VHSSSTETCSVILTGNGHMVRICYFMAMKADKVESCGLPGRLCSAKPKGPKTKTCPMRYEAFVVRMMPYPSRAVCIVGLQFGTNLESTVWN
jgi:hypothetical protein